MGRFTDGSDQERGRTARPVVQHVREWPLKKYGIVDRSEWAMGVWHNEPDYYEWRRYRLVCLARRTYAGVWCGYVGVGKFHPWWKLDYSCIDATVHGGLTYSDLANANSAICHTRQADECSQIWLLGFDCGHGCDLAPAYRLSPTQVYRTLDYVIECVERLADQALAATK